jgi:hypothetical protein
MSKKEPPMEWIFAEEEEATREDLETEEQQQVIGNDDPTVRTAALPDHGLDSAVHDIAQIVRRAPTADA